jgi:hypothetical protein
LPCTKTLGDIIGGWDLHVIAGPNGRPASEIADEVWLGVEEYPQWNEPETTAPREEATDPDLDMLYPPSRAVSSGESPSAPVSDPSSAAVSAPDSDQLVVASESADPESPSGAIGFLATLLVVLIALLLIPLVDRIGWLTNRFLRNRMRTATFEEMVVKETASGAVHKDEAVAPRP